MRNSLKRCLFFAICFAAIVTLGCAAIIFFGAGNPKAGDWIDGIGWLVQWIQTLPLEATKLAFHLFPIGSPMVFLWSLTFLQWFLAGFIIAMLFRKLKWSEASRAKR